MKLVVETCGRDGQFVTTWRIVNIPVGRKTVGSIRGHSFVVPDKRQDA